jgi:hypothetical protein
MLADVGTFGETDKTLATEPDIADIQCSASISDKVG